MQKSVDDSTRGVDIRQTGAPEKQDIAADFRGRPHIASPPMCRASAGANPAMDESLDSVLFRTFHEETP